ncbi:hypothetical protein V6E27_01715 [Bacillus cereus]
MNYADYTIAKMNQNDYVIKFLFRVNGIVINVFQLAQNIAPMIVAIIMEKKGWKILTSIKAIIAKFLPIPFGAKIIKTSDTNIK